MFVETVKYRPKAARLVGDMGEEERREVRRVRYEVARSF